MNACATPSIDVQTDQEGAFSGPQVMKSQAGYYVGCSRFSDDMWAPYSRYSDYMAKREDAQSWLDRAIATDSL